MPNLYEDDELEKAIIATRPAAKSAGILEGNRDEIYEYFISRVRNHLHLVLCMSPAGDALRFVLLLNSYICRGVLCVLLPHCYYVSNGIDNYCVCSE